MLKRYEEIGSEADQLFYAANHALFYGLAWLLANFRSEGTENLPEKGRGIVLFNHLSGKDVILAPCAIPRFAVVIGRRKYVEHPILGPYFRKLGAIAVDVGKENAGREALRQSVETMKQPLNKEQLEIVFGSPNSRTPGQKPGRVNSGVLTAALETETDIYPGVVKGTDRLSDGLMVVKIAPSAGHPDSLKERREFGNYIHGIQTGMFDSIDHPYNYLPADTDKIRW